MLATAPFTVSCVMVRQDEVLVYDILTVPNVAPPVTIPVAVTTDARAGVLLLQVQPGMMLPRFNCEPVQMMPLPVYVAGVGLTVIIAVVLPLPLNV
jgi:hypothetical protein